MDQSTRRPAEPAGPRGHQTVGPQPALQLARVSWRRSLATRLGGVFILIAVLSLALVGLVLIRTARQTQRENIFRLQEKNGREVVLQISAYLNDAQDALSLFERTQSLTALAAGVQQKALENLLIQRRTVFSQITLLNLTGNELAKVSEFHTFTPAELSTIREADLAAASAALSGQFYVSDIFVSPESGLLSVQIGMPVKTSGDQVAGALLAEVKVTRLWQDVSRIEIGQTGYAYLVDQSGRFVAYQEPGEVLQRYGEDMRHMPPVAEFISEGTEHTFHHHEYTGLNGQNVIGLYTPVPGTNWAAIVELPTQEAFATVRQMQTYLVGLTLLGAFVSAGTAFGVSRRFLRPIQQLTSTAQRIGAGDLEATIQAPSQADEVGLLARAFRQMQTELKQLYSGLETQVAERTADLQTTASALASRSQELESVLADLQRRSEELQEATQRQVQINQELQRANELSQRRAARLQASAEVSHAAAQVRDLDKLLPRVTELISHYFGYYHAGIFMIDPNRRFAVLRASNSPGGQRMLARGHKLEIGVTGIVGRVVHTGEPRVALDVGEDAVYFDNPDLPDTRSEMAVPLRVGAEVIGALDVQSTEAGAFDQEDVAVLSTLADQIAVAIENARLLRQAQEAVEELEMTQRLYLQEQWRSTTRGPQTRLGEWKTVETGVEQLPAPCLTASQKALEEGQMVVLENNELDQAFSVMAAPIKLRGQTIGVLDLQETEEQRHWSPDEIALVQTVADQVAQALETARLFTETQRRAERERMIRQITDKVRASSNLETILQTTVQELTRSMGLPRAFVRLGLEEDVRNPGESKESL